MPEIFLKGPAGRIEGRYTQSENPTNPVALILHPHPLHGGTMNNTVVYNLFKTLAQQQFSVLRINFRGVGCSMGKLSEDMTELTDAATIDAATALDWLQRHNPLASAYLIAGFSFGAWITMQLIMRRPEITHFISIAPPVNKYDFSFLSPCPVPGLIIQGNKDSVVDELAVSELAGRLMKQKNINIDYRVIQNADHFFRNKIDHLSAEINDYLNNIFHNVTHIDTLQRAKDKKHKNSSAQKSTQESQKKVFLV